MLQWLVSLLTCPSTRQCFPDGSENQGAIVAVTSTFGLMVCFIVRVATLSPRQIIISPILERACLLLPPNSELPQILTHGIVTLGKLPVSQVSPLPCSQVPVEIIKTRMMTGADSSFGASFKRILKHDGIMGLYTGFWSLSQGPPIVKPRKLTVGQPCGKEGLGDACLLLRVAGVC